MNPSPNLTPTNAPQPCVTPGTEHSFSLDNLTLEDRVALLRFVNLRNGFILKELIPAMSAANLTAAALYQSLAHTTDVRLMIAAAALRNVTRCPDDPQLAPKPHKPAPVRTPRTPEERARGRSSVSVSTVIRGSGVDVLSHVAPNPKRKATASWDRYQLYSVGMTRDQLLVAGLSAADIRWDSERGFIRFNDPAPVEDEELPYQCDVCSTPGYSHRDSPCSCSPAPQSSDENQEESDG